MKNGINYVLSRFDRPDQKLVLLRTGVAAGTGVPQDMVPGTYTIVGKAEIAGGDTREKCLVRSEIGQKLDFFLLFAPSHPAELRRNHTPSTPTVPMPKTAALPG